MIARVASVVSFCVISSLRASIFGINPVNGGRPLVDSIRRAMDRVIAVEVVHVVVKFCSVFVDVLVIIKKIGVVIIM